VMRPNEQHIESHELVGSPPPAADLVRAVRERTSARILVGRAGPAYHTATQLELRRDHAAALDAVHAELQLGRDFGREFVERWGLFEIGTQAESKTQFLMRPDLGRRLNDAARTEITRRCPTAPNLQVVIGDGLSALAASVQVPALLPLLELGVRERGWSWGQPFVIRNCRVGVLNDIGDLLGANSPRDDAHSPGTVVVLLIGERPGLATAESLSAYMAYEPRTGHSDAKRNLISNIHTRGVAPSEAARRIMALAAKMRESRSSGVAVKEELLAPVAVANNL